MTINTNLTDREIFEHCPPTQDRKFEDIHPIVFNQMRKCIDFGIARAIEDGLVVLSEAAKAIGTALKLTDLIDSKGNPKIAPVQGYAPGIPWSLHLEAYDSYCKRYGKQDALIDLEGRDCRGGFGTGELDMFIPGWRDKVSEIGQLKARIAELESAARQPAPVVAALSDLLELYRRTVNSAYCQVGEDEELTARCDAILTATNRSQP